MQNSAAPLFYAHKKDYICKLNHLYMGIFDKGVKKTNQGFFSRLSRAIVGKAKVDDDLLDVIEEALLATDMGVDTTMKIIENLEERVSRDKYLSQDALIDMLRDEIAALLNVTEDAADDVKDVLDGDDNNHDDKDKDDQTGKDQNDVKQ